MFWKPKNKEANRYYLLPGMGRSNRLHHKQTHYAAIVVGLLIAVLLGIALYYLGRTR